MRTRPAVSHRSAPGLALQTVRLTHSAAVATVDGGLDAAAAARGFCRFNSANVGRHRARCCDRHRDRHRGPAGGEPGKGPPAAEDDGPAHHRDLVHLYLCDCDSRVPEGCGLALTGPGRRPGPVGAPDRGRPHHDADDPVEERTNLHGSKDPRGIVAASTAVTFSAPLVALGIGGADRLLPAKFLVIVGTVTIYGLSEVPLSRALGLRQTEFDLEASPR
jgi:hypothetical protein